MLDGLLKIIIDVVAAMWRGREIAELDDTTTMEEKLVAHDPSIGYVTRESRRLRQARGTLRFPFNVRLLQSEETSLRGQRDCHHYSRSRSCWGNCTCSLHGGTAVLTNLLTRVYCILCGSRMVSIDRIRIYF